MITIKKIMAYMGNYAAVVYFNVLFQHFVRHSDKPRNPPIPAGGVETRDHVLFKNRKWYS
jgi:glutaminase